MVKHLPTPYADTDLRLCKFFCLLEGYWLRLRTVYEIMKAKRAFSTALKQIRPYRYPDNHAAL